MTRRVIVAAGAIAIAAAFAHGSEQRFIGVDAAPEPEPDIDPAPAATSTAPKPWPKLLNEPHARIEDGKTELDRQTIAAAIAKRERRARRNA